MQRVTRLVAALAVVLSAADRAQASIVTVNWPDHYPDAFNVPPDLLFDEFLSDELILISDSFEADAFFKSNINGSSVTAFLDVRRNGTWTNILTISTTSNSQNPGNTFTNYGNLTFAPGLIDGLRFSRTIPAGIGTTFNGFDGSSFTFNNLSAVPEPTALLGLGACAGIGALRHRRRNKMASAD